MTPTNRLRFVERVVQAPEYGEGIGKNVRILQQWWEDRSCDVHGWMSPDGKVSDTEGKLFYIPLYTHPHGSPTGSPGEWKDVPIEKENNNG